MEKFDISGISNGLFLPIRDDSDKWSRLYDSRLQQRMYYDQQRLQLQREKMQNRMLKTNDAMRQMQALGSLTYDMPEGKDKEYIDERIKPINDAANKIYAGLMSGRNTDYFLQESAKLFDGVKTFLNNDKQFSSTLAKVGLIRNTKAAYAEQLKDDKKYTQEGVNFLQTRFAVLDNEYSKGNITLDQYLDNLRSLRSQIPLFTNLSEEIKAAQNLKLNSDKFLKGDHIIEVESADYGKVLSLLSRTSQKLGGSADDFTYYYDAKSKKAISVSAYNSIKDNNERAKYKRAIFNNTDQCGGNYICNRVIGEVFSATPGYKSSTNYSKQGEAKIEFWKERETAYINHRNALEIAILNATNDKEKERLKAELAMIQNRWKQENKDSNNPHSQGSKRSYDEAMKRIEHINMQPTVTHIGVPGYDLGLGIGEQFNKIVSGTQDPEHNPAASMMAKNHMSIFGHMFDNKTITDHPYDKQDDILAYKKEQEYVEKVFNKVLSHDNIQGLSLNDTNRPKVIQTLKMFVAYGLGENNRRYKEEEKLMKKNGKKGENKYKRISVENAILLGQQVYRKKIKELGPAHTAGRIVSHLFSSIYAEGSSLLGIDNWEKDQSLQSFKRMLFTGGLNRLGKEDLKRRQEEAKRLGDKFAIYDGVNIDNLNTLQDYINREIEKNPHLFQRIESDGKYTDISSKLKVLSKEGLTFNAIAHRGNDIVFNVTYQEGDDTKTENLIYAGKYDQKRALWNEFVNNYNLQSTNSSNRQVLKGLHTTNLNMDYDNVVDMSSLSLAVSDIKSLRDLGIDVSVLDDKTNQFKTKDSVNLKGNSHIFNIKYNITNKNTVGNNIEITADLGFYNNENLKQYFKPEELKKFSQVKILYNLNNRTNSIADDYVQVFNNKYNEIKAELRKRIKENEQQKK